MTTNPLNFRVGSVQSTSSSTESSLSPFSCDLQISPRFPSGTPKGHRMKRNMGLCVVCYNEPSTVSYLGVRICTGCRAFFRRSVKSQKSYICLNNDLCGNGISNRLTCKFCRWKRCTDVGLLQKKLQLHSDHVERTDHSNFPLIQLNVLLGNNMCPVLSEFTLLRRKICCDRYNTYHGKGTKIEPKEAITGLHDWMIGIFEFDLLYNVGRRCEKLFSQIDSEDWDELMTVDYSMTFTIFTQIENTLRNQGHEDMRIHLSDDSYFFVNDEYLANYLSYVYDNIHDQNKEEIFSKLCSSFLDVTTNFVKSMCKSMERCRLDEAETSALLLLLFTTPSSLLVLSDSTRNLLRELKNATLEGISKHIECTGRNVDERLNDIIFLFTEFQNLLTLAKQAINFLLASTTTNAIPEKFVALIQSSNNRRLKARVMQRVFALAS